MHLLRNNAIAKRADHCMQLALTTGEADHALSPGRPKQKCTIEQMYPATGGPSVHLIRTPITVAEAFQNQMLVS